MTDSYDLVVIGGGAAGLSGAVAAARSRRSVLLLDAGDPRNATAGHVHNFLTRDGLPPAELSAAGRAEVERYGGRVESARVGAIRRQEAGFVVEAGDREVVARRVLVATGARDELPDLPGLAERWGIDVLHCPYCHGWEVRDQRIGVLATGPGALHQVHLFRQLSPRITLLQHTGPAPSEEEQEELHALRVEVVPGVVSAVQSDPGGLTGVVLAEGPSVALDALVVAPRVHARGELLEPLGLHPAEVWIGDHVLGTAIESDPTGATAVPGVWVAGNVTDVRAQVITSAAAGLAAGAAINADLIAEDARSAVEAHRYQRVHGEQAWDERYRERAQAWSGRPNVALVAEVSELAPGRALDAGAGEGADARWLAERGWRVTGVDLSSVALERAAARAEEAGLAVDWRRADLTAEDPIGGPYDLVSACYLHLPKAQRTVVFARLAAAVAPGGVLLIVGHDFADEHTTVPRPGLAEMGWTTEEVVGGLGDGWLVEVAETRPRPATDPEGRSVTIHDAVVRARRG